MTLRRFIVPLMLAVCPAFSQTVFMGHHIGESASQFFAAEPGLESRVDSCRVSEPKPMTAEQIHALSKQDAYALGQQVFATVLSSPDTKYRVKWKRPPNRDELEDLAKQGMPIVIDKRMPDVTSLCHSLLSLATSASSSPVVIQSLPNSRPRPIIWHFRNAALFQMDIDFHGADFGEVVRDLSAKTDTHPNENKEVDTPNLYGATLRVYRRATWLTPELYALLEDDEGTVDGQMHLSVISRAEYDTWAKTHAKKGSLD